jgi:hypothetical protein
MTAFTPITDALDPQLLAVVLELVSAYNQRATVVGLGTITSPAANESTHDTWWRAFQDKLEELVVRFVDHTQGNGDFSGLAGLPLMTVARWRELAEINAAGFTAYTIHPDDGGSPEYRKIKVGGAGEMSDVAGWWVAREIQQGLKALQATQAASVDWSEWDEAPGSHGYGESLVSLADAKAATETDYNAEPYKAASRRGPAASAVWEIATGYVAQTYRYASYAKWTQSAGIALTRTADFYVTGTAEGVNVFKANGDFPEDYEPYTLYRYDIQTGQSGETGQSDLFGKGPPGNVPDWPTPQGEIWGYDCANPPLVIFWWDFEYV